MDGLDAISSCRIPRRSSVILAPPLSLNNLSERLSVKPSSQIWPLEIAPSQVSCVCTAAPSTGTLEAHRCAIVLPSSQPSLLIACQQAQNIEEATFDSGPIRFCLLYADHAIVEFNARFSICHSFKALREDIVLGWSCPSFFFRSFPGTRAYRNAGLATLVNATHIQPNSIADTVEDLVNWKRGRAVQCNSMNAFNAT